jgi:PKD repeat protein
MNLFRLYTLLFFVGLGLSCAKKKYPESVVLNDAVYYTTFNVNGSPNALKAGVDGYYMYSSVEQDSSQIYNFIANLRKTDCQNCPLAVRIQINDYTISDLNEPAAIDLSLQAKAYSYLSQNAGPGYSVNFSSSYNRADPGATYNWSFGDGQVSNAKDPIHTYTAGGTYQVCLSIKGSNSCMSSVCQKVRVASNGFNTTIAGSALAGNSISYSHITKGGFGPYDYFWNFGDGQTSIAQNPSHTYNIQGAYAVTLRIVDARGDTAMAYYNAVTKTDLSSCAANIGSPGISQMSDYQYSLSKIKLSYTDQNGVVFQSNSTTQPMSSLFEIISIEPGDRNEKGELTRKLHVRFNCRVANGSQVKTIDNGDAVICVAYK